MQENKDTDQRKFAKTTSDSTPTPTATPTRRIPKPYTSYEVLPEEYRVPQATRVSKIGESFSMCSYTHGEEVRALTGVLWTGTLYIPVSYMPVDLLHAGELRCHQYLDNIHRYANEVLAQGASHPDYLALTLDAPANGEYPHLELLNQLFRLSYEAQQATIRGRQDPGVLPESVTVTTDFDGLTQGSEQEAPHFVLTARVHGRLCSRETPTAPYALVPPPALSALIHQTPAAPRVQPPAPPTAELPSGFPVPRTLNEETEPGAPDEIPRPSDCAELVSTATPTTAPKLPLNKDGHPVFVTEFDAQVRTLTGRVAEITCHIPLSHVPCDLVAESDVACLMYVYFLAAWHDTKSVEDAVRACSLHPLPLTPGDFAPYAISPLLTAIDSMLAKHPEARVSFTAERRRSTMADKGQIARLIVTATVTQPIDWSEVRARILDRQTSAGSPLPLTAIPLDVDADVHDDDLLDVRRNLAPADIHRVSSNPLHGALKRALSPYGKEHNDNL